MIILPVSFVSPPDQTGGLHFQPHHFHSSWELTRSASTQASCITLLTPCIRHVMTSCETRTILSLLWYLQLQFTTRLLPCGTHICRVNRTCAAKLHYNKITKCYINTGLLKYGFQITTFQWLNKMVQVSTLSFHTVISAGRLTEHDWFNRCWPQSLCEPNSELLFECQDSRSEFCTRNYIFWRVFMVELRKSHPFASPCLLFGLIDLPSTLFQASAGV
jgi:hypothetical protein